MALDETEKRGRGRPRTGKVLFAKRVSPEMQEKLMAVLAGTAAPVVGSETEELRAFNKKLLQDVGELKQEVADLTERLERCSAASDDQKTHWWKKKYDDLLADNERKHGSSQWAQ